MKQKKSYCKGCGAEIVWTVTKNGKHTPVDLDGLPHWASCPQSAMFKRKGVSDATKN